MIEAHEGLASGPIVHIENADRSISYYCDYGHEVRPIQGKTMPWFYRHKKEEPECPDIINNPGVGWGPPR